MGGSGRVFNAMLRTAGIDRAEVLLTHVFDRQAPENKPEVWRTNAERRTEAFDRLASELERARPNVVVPLGPTALWAFTGQTALTPFRGNIVQASRIRPGQKLVPTFHPREVMAQWKFMPVVVQDFVRAFSESRFPEIRPVEGHLLLEPNLDDVRTFLAECRKARLLSVDIETGWGLITSIGFAPNPTVAMSIPFVDLTRPDRSYWRTPETEREVWLEVKHLLEDPSIPKLGQNFTYDAFWLWKRAGIGVRGYVEDTRLKHHAIYPELPKDLAFMSSYTDLGAWKHMGGRYNAETKRDA